MRQKIFGVGPEPSPGSSVPVCRVEMLDYDKLPSMRGNSTHNQDIASTIASRSDELRWEI